MMTKREEPETREEADRSKACERASSGCMFRVMDSLSGEGMVGELRTAFCGPLAESTSLLTVPGFTVSQTPSEATTSTASAGGKGYTAVKGCEAR